MGNLHQISNSQNLSGIGILVLGVLQIWEFAKYVWNRNFGFRSFTDFRNMSGIGILVLGVLQIFEICLE